MVNRGPCNILTLLVHQTSCLVNQPFAKVLEIQYEEVWPQQQTVLEAVVVLVQAVIHRVEGLGLLEVVVAVVAQLEIVVVPLLRHPVEEVVKLVHRQLLIALQSRPVLQFLLQ